ncbi:MerR family transcriptional regulator, partial [Actinomadura adrarensis]
MRIGEVARNAGVTPRAVRYYEEQGLISPERDHNGHRIYSGDAVLLVRNIARLLHAGLSSEDVLRFRDCLVQESPFAPAACSAEAIGVYSERLDVLDRRIAVLTELRDRL